MNYREAVAGIRVGVMAADFSQVLFTNEQLAAVKAALLDRAFDTALCSQANKAALFIQSTWFSPFLVEKKDLPQTQIVTILPL